MSGNATENVVLLGIELWDFAQAHASWSDVTFGDPTKRGPIGPLKHLAKEALEAAEHPDDRMEFADCFLLCLDSARRAGMSLMDLVQAGKEKLAINKQRRWGSPNNGDNPVEHIKEDAN